jgi:hypothetical protein
MKRCQTTKMDFGSLILKKKLLKILSSKNEVAMCVNLNGMVLS